MWAGGICGIIAAMHAQGETTLTLGGGPLSLEMLDPLLEQELTVTIGEGAWQRVQRSTPFTLCAGSLRSSGSSWHSMHMSKVASFSRPGCSLWCMSWQVTHSPCFTGACPTSALK